MRHTHCHHAARLHARFTAPSSALVTHRKKIFDHAPFGSVPVPNSLPKCSPPSQALDVNVAARILSDRLFEAGDAETRNISRSLSTGAGAKICEEKKRGGPPLPDDFTAFTEKIVKMADLLQNEKDAKLALKMARRSFGRQSFELDNIENELSKALSCQSKADRAKAAAVDRSKTDDIAGTTTSDTPAFAKFINNRQDDFNGYCELDLHTDLTSPHEWYPSARLDKRSIIFHAGPTNSGKTHNALHRLKQAKKGMYLAPLRLLAAETYEKLTSEGVYINLLTGQERRIIPFSTHSSSTVELACLEEDFDVVVIDEIQMLADNFRGSAWTQALLGVRCKEVHVCGGAEAISLVKKMCRMCGDDFKLHTYKRFSELKVLNRSLAESSTAKWSYANVEKGDCVVAFSRRDIFAIKREIEISTAYKCCVIYGTLPPGVRAEQARRFNDPTSDYDILVASDAIGMGLNLSIKRIIFNSMYKHNGDSIVQLDHSSVKQIAGRAGRHNSPYPDGEVTCRDPSDMPYLMWCMKNEVRPLKKAGLIPTPCHIELFNRHLEKYGSYEKELELQQILCKFSELATLQGNFFLCRQKSMDNISKLLGGLGNMSTAEKFTLCMSPVTERCPKSKAVLLRYVDKYSRGKVPGVHRSMRPKPASSFDELASLCAVHNSLELFLWLQKKFPSNAIEVIRAIALKESAIEMINNGLFNAEKLSLNYDYIAENESKKKMWAKENKQ